jgi:hypothetical protein
MIRRGAVLIASLVTTGVGRTAGLVVWGVDRTTGLVVWGVLRATGLVLSGVGRTTGLAAWAGDTAVRIWDAAGIDRAATVVTELPEGALGSVRGYLDRLRSVARCRAEYRRLTRPLASRYRQLRKS